MQDLTDCPFIKYLFRLEFGILEEAIQVVKQEYFSVKQDHVSLSSYRHPRRQESGGPEPIDLCYTESESSSVTNHKKLQKCNRFQKTGHYAYECSAPNAVPQPQ